GVVYRGNLLLEGVLKEKVSWNECDSTEALIRCLAKSRYKPQVRLVLLDSPYFSGLNVVDLDEAYHGIGIPVAVVRSRPINIARLNMLVKSRVGKRSKPLSSFRGGFGVKIRKTKLYVYCKGLSEPELIRALHYCADEVGTVTALKSARIIAAVFNRYLSETKRLN
ncbi:MAG: DUF99 family protein, partial [Candidatus Brockarchaeota archaeon]|nr:DUF99 family protein [Candidatus Brockarchaeota archaeon]